MMLSLLITITHLIHPITSKLLCTEKWGNSYTRAEMLAHPAFAVTPELRDQHQVKTVQDKVEAIFWSLCDSEIGDWTENAKI